MLETPVLLLIFNRPGNTSEVFESIKKAKPRKLFVAADGPRQEKEGEDLLCQQARMVATKVDWDCEVKTLFREKNLGCKIAVSSGISWFFEQVEQGIILEDDCKPNPSFYGFCEQLLNYYRHDPRIMMICGTNYLSYEISSSIEHSYFFANYYPIWGWATWKRAWSMYDVDMKNWEKFKVSKQLSWLFSSQKISRYYESMFDLIKNGFDTWDIQWWYACIFHNGLSIIPRYNLVSNIGITGTHTSTQGNFSINMPTYGLGEEEMLHPAFTIPDKYLNEMTYKMSHAQINVVDDVNGNIVSGHVPTPNSIRKIVTYFLRRLVKS